MNPKQRRAFPALVLSLALSLPGLATAAPQAAQVPPAFGEQIEVSVVNVEVYVTDRQGRRIPGLRREDFELYEDGRRMEIGSFAAFEQPSAGSPLVQIGVPSGPGGPGRAAVTEAAAEAPEPMQVVVYIDNANIRPAHRNRAVRQIRDFLTQSLSPGARVMLVSHENGLRIRLPFTEDREALARALEEAEKLAVVNAASERDRIQALRQIYQVRMAGLSDPDPEQRTPCPLDIVQPARSYAETARGEVLRTIGALTVLVNSLSGLPGRKVVLHVSDGISITPGQEVFQVLFELCSDSPNPRLIEELRDEQPLINAPLQDAVGGESEVARARSYRGNQASLDAQIYSTAKEWSALAAHASSHRVTLYTLQASGAEAPAGSAVQYGPGEQILQEPAVASIEESNRKDSLSVMAVDTGGRAVFNANDLRPALAGIQEDLGTYYSLGYSPPHSGDGKAHRIEVRVKRPGVQIRHRLTYRDKPPLERAVDRTLSTLFHGIEDNPLEIAMEIGEPAPAEGGKLAVPIRLRIPLFKVGTEMKEEDYQARLRLLVATRSADGTSTPVRQVQVPIRIPRSQAMTALAQYYLYELTLHLSPGEQRIAVTVRDDMTLLTSFLGRTVQVGGGTPSR